MARVRKKKLYTTTTQDGWRIALHRYPNSESRYPILLVHGLASNALNMDFPLEELSLAKYLHRAGFDTWIVDLRGSGLSKRKGLRPHRWTFDDYVFRDLPVTIEKILQITKAPRLHWLGHSLGGLLAFPFHQTYAQPEVFQSLVTLAAPLTTHARVGYFKYLYHLDGLLRWLPTLPYASISKAIALYPKSLMLFKNQILFSRENMNEEILRHLLKEVVESVPSSLILQIHSWFRHNYFASLGREVDYLANMDTMNMPILMMTGTADSFISPADVRLAFRQIPNADKTFLLFGEKQGHQHDYGHVDLLLGKNAPQEVFPHIVTWLKKHDAR